MESWHIRIDWDLEVHRVHLFLRWGNQGPEKITNVTQASWQLQGKANIIHQVSRGYLGGCLAWVHFFLITAQFLFLVKYPP